MELIARIIEGWDRPTEVPALLEQHRAVLSERLSAQQRALDQLQDLLGRKGSLMSFDVTVRAIGPEAVAVFRHRGRPEDRPGAEPFGRLVDFIVGCGATPVKGIGLANAFDWPEMVDLELGYVTDTLIGPDKEFVSRVLDGGSFACLAFHGYERRSEAYEVMGRWTHDTGAEVRGPAREYHLELFYGASPGSTFEQIADAYNTTAPFELAWPIF